MTETWTIAIKLNKGIYFPKAKEKKININFSLMPSKKHPFEFEFNPINNGDSKNTWMEQDLKLWGPYTSFEIDALTRRNTVLKGTVYQGGKMLGDFKKELYLNNLTRIYNQKEKSRNLLCPEWLPILGENINHTVPPPKLLCCFYLEKLHGNNQGYGHVKIKEEVIEITEDMVDLDPFLSPATKKQRLKHSPYLLTVPSSSSAFNPANTSTRISSSSTAEPTRTTVSHVTASPTTLLSNPSTTTSRKRRLKSSSIKTFPSSDLDPLRASTPLSNTSEKIQIRLPSAQSSCETRLSVNETKLKEIELQKENLNMDQNDTKQRLSGNEKKLKEMGKVIKIQREAIQQLKKNVAEKESKLNSRNLEYKKEISNLKNGKEERAKRMQDIQEQKYKLNTEKKEIEQRLSVSKESLKEIKEQHNKLNAEKNESEEKLFVNEKRLMEMEEQKNENIFKFQKEEENFKTDIEKSKKEIESLKKSQEKYETDLAYAKMDNEEKIHNIEKLEQNLGTLKEEQIKMKNVLSNSEKSLKEMKEDIKTLHEEKEKLQNNITENIKNIDFLSKNVNWLEKDKQENEKQLISFKKRECDINNFNKEITQEKKNMQKNLESQKNMLEEQNEKIELLKKQLAVLEKEKGELLDDIEKNTIILEEEKKIREKKLSKTEEEHQIKINSLTQVITDQEEILKDNNDKIKNLRDQLAVSEEKYEEKTTKIASFIICNKIKHGPNWAVPFKSNELSKQQLMEIQKKFEEFQLPEHIGPALTFPGPILEPQESHTQKTNVPSNIQVVPIEYLVSKSQKQFQPHVPSSSPTQQIQGPSFMTSTPSSIIRYQDSEPFDVPNRNAIPIVLEQHFSSNDHTPNQIMSNLRKYRHPKKSTKVVSNAIHSLGAYNSESSNIAKEISVTYSVLNDPTEALSEKRAEIQK